MAEAVKSEADARGAIVEDGLTVEALRIHAQRLVALLSIGHPRAAEFTDVAQFESLPAAAAALLSLWFAGDRLFRFLGGRSPIKSSIDTSDLDWMWQARWFAKGAAQDLLDSKLEREYAPLLEKAARGELDSWAASGSMGTLALIILVDQLSRNIHRGRPGAWSTDAQALRLVNESLRIRMEQRLPPIMRCMFFMPLVHSEAMHDQHRFDEAIGSILEEVEATQPSIRPWFTRFQVIARRHADVIAIFGRFPERNVPLGRASTQAELAYLSGAQEGSTVKSLPDA